MWVQRYGKIIRLSGIYIHIPFCRHKCRYCDFYSTASTARQPLLFEALHRELESRRGEISGPVRTLYFGGGTPSLCAPNVFQTLIDRVRSLYDADFEEITIEANPDDLADDYLTRLRQTDVDRLSIGIQSFHDAHLRFFNRRHTGREGHDAVRRAQEHGFENITVDLIYGFSGLTEAEWESDLLKVKELDVPHLSAYHLTIEPRTTLGRWAAAGRITPVSDEISQRHYEILERLTAEAGYDHYEVSNFARPGREAIHNSRYWDGTPYLGIGPAAHSFDGHTRRWNVSDIQRYIAGFEHQTETLTAVDRFNETLLTGLRQARGVAWATLGRCSQAATAACEQRPGGDFVAATRAAAAKYLATGLLIDDGTRLRIPTEHFLISDAIISDLFL